MTTITYMTKAQMRDIRAKRDAHISKLGQASAQRYLDSKQAPKTRGRIRKALMVLLTAFTIGAIIGTLTK